MLAIVTQFAKQLLILRFSQEKMEYVGNKYAQEYVQLVPKTPNYQSKSAENYQNIQWAYICKYKSQMPKKRFLPALCFHFRLNPFIIEKSRTSRNMCVYVNTVECIDYSVRSYAFGNWIEKSNYFNKKQEHNMGKILKIQDVI
ncbi:Hypothetical_protein [Hexamita inflata]|uniref:Hypothetical_protein n=1 Tax=Hexamita inflata TaxID=28002 RepID=A0AA86UWI9_9EUKA|nr:Hypothetical protein HINF_LOCUS62370 [Hexamita inflata]